MRALHLDNVFTVPFLDGYLLYFPRKGLVLGVDKTVHDLIITLKAGRSVQPSNFTNKWFNALFILGNEDDKVLVRPLNPFKPTHVTLSLTKSCSLRCIYCYARAGEVNQDIDPKVAHAALRFAADNALEIGATEFRVAFHGEGEPTHSWSLFKESILYAEDLAKERRIGVEFSMSTNAIWGREQRQFIAKYFRHVSVSLDGLPEIQNLQRPMANGKGSFDIVLSSLRAMDEAGVAYGVRSTVLPEGVEKMHPFLEFLAGETHADTLTLEPVFQSGRGVSLEIDKEKFYRHFTEAYRAVQRRGAELGVDVTYSGCRPTVTAGRFCQAIGPDLNCVVMTNGLVSSCYEINDPDSAKGSMVIYGKFDPASDRFIFDEEKLNRLREHGVWNMPGCRDCFAKWNCGGDCLARCDLTLAALDSDEDRSGSPRCELNRSLTAEALVMYGMAADVLDGGQPF